MTSFYLYISRTITTDDQEMTFNITKTEEAHIIEEEINRRDSLTRSRPPSFINDPFFFHAKPVSWRHYRQFLGKLLLYWTYYSPLHGPQRIGWNHYVNFKCPKNLFSFQFVYSRVFCFSALITKQCTHVREITGIQTTDFPWWDRNSILNKYTVLLKYTFRHGR